MPQVSRLTVLLQYSPPLLLRDVVQLEQVVMAVWNALRVHVIRSTLNAGPFWYIDFEDTLFWTWRRRCAQDVPVLIGWWCSN